LVAGDFCISLSGVDASSSPSSRQGAASDLPLRRFVFGAENALLADLPSLIFYGQAIRFPLLLYGPSGTGKTVLLRSLLAQWAKAHRNHHLICSTGKDFASRKPDTTTDVSAESAPSAVSTSFDAAEVFTGPDLLEAIPVRSDSLGSVNGHYSAQSDSGDSTLSDTVLFLDNLEQLQGRYAAQRRLQATLDLLESNQGRFVATSRTHPLELPIESSLRSRLSAGLTIQVHQPEAETRASLLMDIAMARGLYLHADAASELAAQLPFGFFHLRNAVMALQVQVAPSATIRSDDVQQYLASRSVPFSLRLLSQHVVRHCQISLDELKSKSRQQCFVQARCLFIYLARTVTPATYAQIAQFLGGRNETTVIHAFKKCETYWLNDPDWSWSMQQLKTELNTV